MNGKPLTQEEWLAERRKFIGGSDAAAVCGVSPWATPFDVWLSKTQGIYSEQTEPAYWGHKHERALLERFQEDHPELGVMPLQHEIYRHKELKFMGCTPDGFANMGDMRRALIEAKSTDRFQADRWGDPGTDQIPDEVLVQCLHNMIVASSFPGPYIDLCYIPLLIGGNEYRLYEVHRSEATKETEQRIIDTEREFWEKYVLTELEPDYGDSNLAREYLKKKFPADVTEQPDVANESEAAAIQRLKELFEASAKAESAYAGQVNAVKALIGDRCGLASPSGKVTWKKQKDSERTDYKAALYQLQPLVNEATFNAAISEHTEICPGPRKFNKPRNWGKE